MFGMSNEVRALPFWGLAARMFEIVKRQHIRQAGPLGPANQRRPAAVVPDMLGKQNMSLAEKLKTGLSLTILCGSAERTWIVRVIKCRKSIWWMPWR